jgi:hypothetical protein
VVGYFFYHTIILVYIYFQYLYGHPKCRWEKWKTTFTTTCWFLWIWRNKTIFKEDFQKPNNPVLVTNIFTRGMNLCSTQPIHWNFQRIETIYIDWNKTPENRIKFNNDNVSKGGGESSSCDDVFRNFDGRQIKRYIGKVGVCDALHAKLWGMACT